MFDYNNPFSSFGGKLNGADVMRFTDDEKRRKLKKAAIYMAYDDCTMEAALLNVGLDINRLSRQDLSFLKERYEEHIR